MADGEIEGSVVTAPWQAWFDGSALPNPGKMGIGFVLQSPDGVCHERSFVAREPGCNNEAELYALCALLELAHEYGARQLLVYGDSDVAVKYASGIGSTEISRLLTLVRRSQNLLAAFDEVSLKWVPRHRNAAADQLSRQALGLAPKHPRSKSKKRGQC